ncbi:hypothetical protein Mgra_00002398 [Meloidogyne graminicola]|uniref:Uncharacterized protein n=1 Tax=Meloidogyne graminicola TaxID=189291 RepID=A0A8S9ZWY7_9BILA|nr:hypothetical protein Mgra_00002398 [Meloidogyne graminicola]
MLLSDVKMPIDNLLVLSTTQNDEGEDDDEEDNYFVTLSIPEEYNQTNIIDSDLMIVHSKSLEEVKINEREEEGIFDNNWNNSFGGKKEEKEEKEEKEDNWEEYKKNVEEIEEPQQRIKGSSLEASPSEKRRRRSSANSAHGSTNGSLSEFERIEQEIIESGGGIKILSSSSPQHSPEGGKRIKTKQQSPTKEGGINRGSADSLNEFEQLEREINEAVASEDIMMLSDIREDEEEEEGYEISEEEENNNNNKRKLEGINNLIDNELKKRK